MRGHGKSSKTWACLSERVGRDRCKRERSEAASKRTGHRKDDAKTGKFRDKRDEKERQQMYIILSSSLMKRAR